MDDYVHPEFIKTSGARADGNSGNGGNGADDNGGDGDEGTDGNGGHGGDIRMSDDEDGGNTASPDNTGMYEIEGEHQITKQKVLTPY